MQILNEIIANNTAQPSSAYHRITNIFCIIRRIYLALNIFNGIRFFSLSLLSDSEPKKVIHTHAHIECGILIVKFLVFSPLLVPPPPLLFYLFGFLKGMRPNCLLFPTECWCSMVRSTLSQPEANFDRRMTLIIFKYTQIYIIYVWFLCSNE